MPFLFRTHTISPLKCLATHRSSSAVSVVTTLLHRQILNASAATVATCSNALLRVKRMTEEGRMRGPGPTSSSIRFIKFRCIVTSPIINVD